MNHPSKKIINKFLQIPHPPGSGGPGSFQFRFEDGLKKRGWHISYAGNKLNGKLPDVIFVVGGTRKLAWLYRMKRKGVPIIYRLDGIVWLHKKHKRGFKHYMTAEFRNLSSKIIHAFLANVIVYQSKFVQQWWDREGFCKADQTYIIHNGAQIPGSLAKDVEKKRLVVLEGTIDYSPYAVRLLNELAEKLPEEIYIELYGKFENRSAKDELHEAIDYKGFIPHEKVYKVLTGSVYLTLDINPACPNTVVEALACGAPVVGFKTGAIGEMVDNKSGEIVEYGANPWSLAYPDVNALIIAIEKIFYDYSYYSKHAANRAKVNYDINNMIEEYLNIFNRFINNRMKDLSP